MSVNAPSKVEVAAALNGSAAANDQQKPQSGTMDRRTFTPVARKAVETDEIEPCLDMCCWGVACVILIAKCDICRICCGCDKKQK